MPVLTCSANASVNLYYNTWNCVFLSSNLNEKLGIGYFTDIIVHLWSTFFLFPPNWIDWTCACLESFHMYLVFFLNPLFFLLFT